MVGVLAEEDAVVLSTPQSLNLYAYARNNPLLRVDPDGDADVAALCRGQATCQKTLMDTQ